MAEKTGSKSQGRSRPQAQSKAQGRTSPQKSNPDARRGGSAGGAKGAANGTASRKPRGEEQRSQQKSGARGTGGEQGRQNQGQQGDAQSGGGAGKVGDTLKQHPITTAALGAGLTLLAAQGLRLAINAKSQSGADESDDQADQGEEEDAHFGASGSGEQDEEGEESEGESEGDDEGEDSAGFAGRLRQGASSLGRIGSKFGQAFRGSGEAIKRGAQSGYDRGRQSAGEGWTSHPLFLCGVALAVGAAAGFMIPPTRQEDQMLGKHSDKLAGRFKKGGQEAFRQGRTIAGKVIHEAVNTASKEAEREGVTPDRLGKKFKRVFSNVRDAVAEAVQED